MLANKYYCHFITYRSNSTSFASSAPIDAGSGSGTRSESGSGNHSAASSVKDGSPPPSDLGFVEVGDGGSGSGSINSSSFSVAAAAASTPTPSSSSSQRAESSPIREALLTKFAKFAPATANSSSSAATSASNTPNSKSSSGGIFTSQEPQSLPPCSSSSSSSVSSRDMANAGPPQDASSSWLNQVKGRIAKTVEEKYSEYKHERERRLAAQRHQSGGGGSGSLDLHDDDSFIDVLGRSNVEGGAGAGNDDCLSLLSHSHSENVLDTASSGYASLPDMKSSASGQSLATRTAGASSDHASESSGDEKSVKSLPAVESLTTASDDADGDDAKTPLVTAAAAPASDSSPKTTPKERRKFTFSFLEKARSEKSTPATTPNKADRPTAAAVDGEAGAASAASTSSGVAADTPQRQSLKLRMMGLMGKTPTSTAAAESSRPMSLRDLNTPSVEDPFSGVTDSPETEENSFAAPPLDDDDGDDQVETALEADEKLVFEPSTDVDDSLYVYGEGEGEGVDDDADAGRPADAETGGLFQYWWMACLPLCVVLSLQLLPLPGWLSGFLTGVLLAVPLSVYVVWTNFVQEGADGEPATKFVENIRRKRPKRPAIIVQEELERKYTWMNMWPPKNGPYDPLTYDVRRTMSVRVMLHGPWIELKFPKRNLPLRRMYDDAEPTSVAFLQHSEVIDLSNCAIDLIPENLPGKRIWSKKYPIRIRTNVRKPCTDPITKETHPASCHEPDPVAQTAAATPGTDEDEPDDSRLLANPAGAADEAVAGPAKDVDDDENDEFTDAVSSQEAAGSGAATSAAASAAATNPADQPFTVIEDSKTFYLFTRTSREKEEWFGQALQGARFMQDWNVQSPLPEEKDKLDPDYETHKIRQQKFKMFMEDYFQARHAEGAEKVHEMTKEDESKQQIAREQMAFLNIFGARLWHDLHKSKAFIDLLREKLTRKLLKVKIAQYFEEVAVTTLDLGQRLPQIKSASLPWQDEMGLWVNLEIEYNGVCQATVETQGIRLPGKDEPDREAQELVSRPRPAATLDSDEEDSAEDDDDLPDNPENLDLTSTGGPHEQTVHGAGFRVRVLEGLLKSDFVAKVAETEWVKKNITGKNITLQLQLHSLKGTLTVNMPKAPSDRIWYGFRQPPQLDIALRPIFAGRSLGKYEGTFAAMMRHLEKRLKQEFMKVLVFPNMDDEVLVFLDHVPYGLYS